MIELSDLTYLVAVKDQGTLSAVAKTLHVSQPVLTRRMQKLEEEFGVPLFERTKNKITLNEDGILAAGYARKILIQTENMVELVRTQAHVRSTVLVDPDASGSVLEMMQQTMKNYPGLIVSMNRNRVRMQNTLHIGACSYVPALEMMEHIIRNYPETEMSLEFRDKQFLLEELKTGRHRAVILPYPADESGMICSLCGQERFLAALPAGHPLSGREGIYAAELDGERMLSFPGNEDWIAFARGKMPRSEFSTQPVNELMAELYRVPELPFFTSDCLDRQLGHPDNRVLVPMLDPEAAVTYYAVYRKSDRLALEKFFP